MYLEQKLFSSRKISISQVCLTEFNGPGREGSHIYLHTLLICVRPLLLVNPILVNMLLNIIFQVASRCAQKCFNSAGYISKIYEEGAEN